MHEGLMALGVSKKEVYRLLVSEVGAISDARGKTLSIQQQIAKKSFNAALRDGLMHEIEVGCPVCGEQKFEDFCAIDRIGLKVQTVMCSQGPTLYSRKRFDEHSLKIFYSRFYREIYTGSPDPTEGWFEEQVSSGRRILGQLKKLNVVSNGLSDKHVLEVGCGSGGILIPFLEAGAEVVGIDFDDAYMNAGRQHGLNLIAQSIYEFNPLEKFNLIILKDVLEHLPNLKLVLAKLKALLDDDGHVYIQVPTFEGLEFLGYQNDFLRYFQNAHIVHFSEASLNFIFAESGFQKMYSNINGLAIFQHKVGSEHYPFDLLIERKLSLDRIVNILKRRRKVVVKERIWKLSPIWLIKLYHLIRRRET